MLKPYTVPVSAGGHLATVLSAETVGESNYVAKTNLRRFADCERRQEGWILFEPVTGASQAIFDGTETVLRLAEFLRPNGDRILVGASRTKIKAFYTATGLWTDISGGLTFSASGKRWQVMSSNGYLVLNNAVNLPVQFRVEWATIKPLYELREVGVSCVGRISEYNGFLTCADVTEIQADQLDKWMNGYSTYAASSTVAENANFSIASGDTTKEFDVTTGATDKTATLPSPQAIPTFWCWIKKADNGAGRVLTSPAIVNQPVILTAINDIALVWSDGSQYKAKVFSGGTIPATDPYGTPPTDIVNRVPWEWINSEFGDPSGWAPLFSVYMSAASATLDLPFATHALTAGVDRVAVIGGGPDGGTLGGQSDYPVGILITGITGAAITLEETTDTGITYPCTVKVTRWRDISTIVGRYLLQGDGSAIIGLATIGNLQALFRDTGIYVGRYTGDITNPFVFTPRYPPAGSTSSPGSNVPLFPDAIANVNGDYLLYPGNGGHFYKFDGVNWPSVHSVCDDACDLFFDGIDPTTEVFVVDNPLTKQIWFCRPDLTFCLDYDTPGGTVSIMDAEIDAACICKRPGSTDDWFILGIAGNVFTYGAVVDALVPIQTWLRNGVAPGASIKSGLIWFGDRGNEKDLLKYVPELSSSSPDAEFEVQLYATYDPKVAPTALMTPAATLPDALMGNMLATFFRAIYFQDEITLTDTRDIDFRLSARTFEFDRIASGGINRTNL